MTAIRIKNAQIAATTNNTMTFSQFLKEYWQVIISLVGIFTTWWRFSIKLSNWQILNDATIKDLAKEIAETKARVDAVYPILVTLQTDMASVKTSLEFIKGSVTQIVKNQ